MIGLNTVALVIVTVYFFIETADRNLREQEGGWTAILFILAVAVILLAAVPLRMSQSTFSLCFSAFFAFLPLGIWLYNVAGDKLSAMKKQPSQAEFYFQDKTQRSIATAIENGDTSLVQELIKGQDLNIQGNRVWDADGLNYLQFAIRLRRGQNFKGDTAANSSIIKLLVKNGSATTRALAEGITGLPLEISALLLDSGADPNTYAFVYDHALLFSVIGATRQDVDAAILLVKKGARLDVLNQYQLTPLMYAANNSDTSAHWFETWRFVRFLLEEQHVDYSFTNRDGNNFEKIITSIQVKAKAENITMPSDFGWIVTFLNKNKK